MYLAHERVLYGLQQKTCHASYCIPLQVVKYRFDDRGAAPLPGSGYRLLVALVRRGLRPAGACIAACIHSLARTNSLDRSCSDFSFRASWMQSSAKLSKSASGLASVRFNMAGVYPAVTREVPPVADSTLHHCHRSDRGPVRSRSTDG